jgi:predicted branched-subunit amino acid permease
VDFALTALFVVLLMDQLRRGGNGIPALIGGSCAVAALILVGPGNMLIASLAGALAVLSLFRGVRR